VKVRIIPHTMMRLHIQNPTWQQQMADVVTDGLELCHILQLDPAQLSPSVLRQPEFPVRVPRLFVERMQAGNPNDPLLLQVLANRGETITDPGFSRDPVGDLDAIRHPGLLHKYGKRVLIVTTGACAIHCRYCFRRHYPYAAATSRADDWGPLLQYLQENQSVNEVILSGGDPLSLSDRRLRALIQALETVTQVTTVRIHSRIPTIIPRRIDESFCNIFQHSRLSKVMVVHVNHPQEINGIPTAPFDMLRNTGFCLLNQSVLLKGINDKADILASLSESLFKLGILPYYLHQLDKVAGATGFQVSAEHARTLYQSLAAQLPGYLLPRFVQEVAGEPNKTLIRL